jgi:hypothetical protein
VKRKTELGDKEDKKSQKRYRAERKTEPEDKEEKQRAGRDIEPVRHRAGREVESKAKQSRKRIKEPEEKREQSWKRNIA